MSIPSVPPWLVDLFHKWPWAFPIGFVVYALYRLVKDPIAFATFVGVLGGEKRRKDAKEIVEILCDKEDDPPVIGHLFRQPARNGRRRRRRKRRGRRFR